MAQSVLVAEPDAALRDMYRSALESDGWAVEVAGDGHAALARVAVSRPGVLLLSTTPNLAATAVLKRLRDNKATRDLAVIVLTNSGDEADLQRWHELGVLGALIKSRRMRAKLSETIVGLLERRASGATEES